MSENARLWKFWTWEIVLALVLLAVGAGALFYRPELVPVVQAQPVEIRVVVCVLTLIAVSALAYCLATGTLAGVLQWLVRLVGSVLIVSSLILLPVVAFIYLRRPESLNPLSPFVALFVLWCLYGMVFLVRWQTRLFYGLVERIERKRGVEKKRG